MAQSLPHFPQNPRRSAFEIVKEKQSPAFQWYAAEYLADEHVQCMTLEHEGAYARLLSYCWREGSIPSDDQALSMLCKGASTTVISVVKSRFRQHPDLVGRLTHKRLDEEREKQAVWRKKSADGGKKSAKKRWGSNTNKNVRVVRECLHNGDNQSLTLPSSSSSSLSKKPYSPLRDLVGVADAEMIYQAYPRKAARKSAIKAIQKACKEISLDDLLEKVKAYAAASVWMERQYIPHPATWFNDGRWDDPLPERPTNPFSNGRHHPATTNQEHEQGFFPQS